MQFPDFRSFPPYAMPPHNTLALHLYQVSWGTELGSQKMKFSIEEKRVNSSFNLVFTKSYVESNIFYITDL